MKFAITGASGFIGVHLIHHLLQAGHEVLAIKRPSSSLAEFELVGKTYTVDNYSGLQWRDAELYDVEELINIFKEADHVIHAAGFISYHNKHLQEMFKVNVAYTAHVVNACIAAEVSGFCHISSTSAIGKTPGKALLDEDERWEAGLSYSNYGLSKHLAELEVYRGMEEGLPVVMVNPGVVLGFSDWNKGSSQLFKRAFREFPFYSDGITGFTAVEDLCEVIMQLSEKEITGEKFIVVNGNYSFKEVLYMIASGLNKKPPQRKVAGWVLKGMEVYARIKKWFGIGGLISVETVSAATSTFSFSNERITQTLDYTFVPLENRIAETCMRYKKSPPK